jgi:entry exclusion lipoprotein TrbK
MLKRTKALAVSTAAVAAIALAGCSDNKTTSEPPQVTKDTAATVCTAENLKKAGAEGASAAWKTFGESCAKFTAEKAGAAAGSAPQPAQQPAEPAKTEQK